MSDPPNNVGICGEGLNPTNRRSVSKAPGKTWGGGRKLSVISTSSLLLWYYFFYFVIFKLWIKSTSGHTQYRGRWRVKYEKNLYKNNALFKSLTSLEWCCPTWHGPSTPHTSLRKAVTKALFTPRWVEQNLLKKKKKKLPFWYFIQTFAEHENTSTTLSM